MIVSDCVIASGEEDFKQGLLFYESGEYSRALEKYKSARREGMRTSQIYYHIGKVYFELEDYINAENYFMAIRNAPTMNALAEYNLGLVALKLNEQEKAIKYFKSVIENDRDQKLVFLSRKRLQEYGVVDNPWSVYVSAKFGYDDNINIAPEDVALNESGRFLDTVVSVEYLLAEKRGGSWTGEARFYRINYFETDSYDEDQYGVSFKRAQRLNDWSTHFKLGIDKLTYGVSDYQSIIFLDARAGNEISDSGVLNFSFRYEDIRSDLPVYDYLQGWRQKYRFEYYLYATDSRARLYYELELNDRQDLYSGANIYSYSPTRHIVRGVYTKIFNEKWRITGDLSYRISNYPATVSLNRHDDRWKATISVDYRLTKDMRILMSLEYINNDSNDLLYDYDRKVAMVGLSKLF